MDVTVFSPAKINLSLAITGRRPDGFHDLVSVVALLDFGDQLVAEAGGRRPEAGGSRFSLSCDNSDVPTDGSNLVLKAAEAFAAATGWPGPAHFRLTKRIPPGAGLGGGSSNAVAALRALNRLTGDRLDGDRLAAVAVTLGSDCALFLANAPAVMRGRGERLELLSAAATARLQGRKVLLFKPSFGVSTPWAYGRMVTRGTDYVPAAEAEERLAGWIQGSAPAEDLLRNNMEPAVYEKYLALPVLGEKLSREFGVKVRMSGSGSACYALLPDNFAAAPVVEQIRRCWGPSVFIRETRVL